MMKKYTEIYPDGQRAYQFVADTAYVRESGTKGEHKAAEYILKTAEQVAARFIMHTYFWGKLYHRHYCNLHLQFIFDVLLCK